jgi:hypothetical protein
MKTLAFLRFQRCQQHRRMKPLKFRPLRVGKFMKARAVYVGGMAMSVVAQKVFAKLQWKRIWEVVSGPALQTTQVSLSRIFFLQRFTRVWSLPL